MATDGREPEEKVALPLPNEFLRKTDNFDKISNECILQLHSKCNGLEDQFESVRVAE